MNPVLTEKIEDGIYSLEAIITITQDGFSIYLGGGTMPHIGTVVISQPRFSLSGDGSISCTTSCYNLLNHKDDGIGVPFAEELCKKLNKIVVVTAGIHLEQANAKDLKKLEKNATKLQKKILKALKNLPQKDTNGDADVCRYPDFKASEQS